MQVQSFFCGKAKLILELKFCDMRGLAQASHAYSGEVSGQCLAKSSV